MKHYYSYLAINYYRILFFVKTEIKYVESIRVMCVINPFVSDIFSFHIWPLE
jgi:hypothetical protein